MKKKKAGALRSLFASTLKIGFIGFGGGSALIPVIQKPIVEDKKLVGQTEYEEDVVVASVTPGALPVEISGCIGKRIAGWKGMLLGAFGMAFPGVLLTLAFLSVISFVDTNVFRQIQFLTVGITAFIACLLSDYIVGTVQKEKTKIGQWINIGIVVMVFLLTCGKNIYRILNIAGKPLIVFSNIQIFALAFLIIFVVQVFCWIKKRLPGVRSLDGQRIEGRKNGIQSMVKEIVSLTVVVLIFGGAAFLVTEKVVPYLANGLLSSLMSFGGGDAYLTVAEGLFVNGSMISEENFYGNLVPLVNVLPGSILCKTLSGIGFYIGMNETGSLMGAYVVALAGFAVSILGSCGVVSVVGYFYNAFHNMDIFIAIRRFIRPIVAGLMLNVILSLIYQNSKLGNGQSLGIMPVVLMIVIFFIDLFLYRIKKCSSGKLVIISVVLALVFCNGYSMLF